MTRWRTVQLGEALELAYGKSLPKRVRTEGGQVPVYGSNGVVGWHVEALVDGPTIVVGRKGSAGAVRYVDSPCYPIDTTYFVRPRIGFEFDMKFLFYLLRRLDLSRLKTATGVPGLTREDAYRERIPVPPIDEQRRIVDVLSRAEGIVRLRREAQAKAAEIIPALFLDMFGDPATNPKGWPFIAIDDLVTPIEFGISAALSKDAEYRPGRTGVLRIANLTGDGRLDLSDVRYLTVSEKKRAQLLLREGDILFNWRNSPKWIGKTAIVEKDIDCIFASFLYRFRALDNRSDKTFLWFYLNFLRERGVFESMCRQAVSQANLGRDELGVIRIMVPPIEAQLTFAKKCEALFSIRRQLEEADAKADAAFSALLSRAFSRNVGAETLAAEEAAVA